MPWKPHKNSQARIESARNLIIAILTSPEIILPEHRREFVKLALGRLTESEGRGKTKTRYISQRARESSDKLVHEHVETRKHLADKLLKAGSDRQKLLEILGTAVACTVTREEHSSLKDSESGWLRYKDAGITVYDQLNETVVEPWTGPQRQ